MPIYEYQCDACGHHFEKLQKLSDEPLVECPVCKEPKLKKLISAAAFRLKGGGWYETDFKKDNKRNLSAGSEGDNGKGSEPASGKSDGADGASSDAKTSDKKSSSEPTPKSSGESGKSAATKDT